ncbi:MAG: AbrB/MazE/SpoVT family DNA-binding domain-containing protein [Candidatus Shapirobacteria bacterium]|jgi:antitoxin component of MazEF toxin-antitoxin module|nr:AbrB/MazE/SpoVT family DNA-binding domain-containing protein [Candidatus Shapirobacteria bacterium]
MDKTRKVIKTGNSLALTIPNKVIKSFDIKEGDLAQYKISSSKTSITYTFSGHPRQLSLGYAEK